MRPSFTINGANASLSGIPQVPDWHGITPCPSAGHGVHDWLFATACRLAREGLADDNIARHLVAWTCKIGREIPEREISEAVRNARRTVSNRDSGLVSGWRHRMAKASEHDTLHALERARRESGVRTLSDLVQRSPMSPPVDTDAFIDAMFPADCLICAGSSPRKCLTMPREDWRGIWDGYRHIVPSPMLARTGLNRDKRESARCLDNTGPRRFLVLESDDLSYDDSAAVFAWIGRSLPLAAVVYSGGKSLHAWYWVEGVDEDVIDRLRSQAPILRLDPAMFVRCQPTRTPCVMRDEPPRLQQCLYFAGIPTSTQ